MKIYNYNNDVAVIALPQKPIAEISVIIITGDEVVTVDFVDGTSKDYDASILTGNPRIMGYYDGGYTVKKDMINDWMDYQPDENRIASYHRKELFGGN